MGRTSSFFAIFSRLIIAFAAVAGVLIAGTSASAATYTWANAGTDWATSANWSPSTVPGSSDVGRFNSANYSGFQPNLAQANTIGGLWSTGAAAR